MACQGNPYFARLGRMNVIISDSGDWLIPQAGGVKVLDVIHSHIEQIQKLDRKLPVSVTISGTEIEQQ